MTCFLLIKNNAYNTLNMKIKFFFISALIGTISINNIGAQQNKVVNLHAVYLVSLKQNTGALLVQDTCDLFISDKKSWFSGRNKNNMLQVLQNKRLSNPSGETNLSYTDFAGINKPLPFSILKNYETNDVVILEDVEDQWLGYKDEEAKNRQWQITEEKDTIQNLLCTKATFENNGVIRTVWYSPNIPINDGPLRGFGLPGLVVKYQDNKGWEASIISISYDSKVQLDIPEKYTITTSEKIKKAKKIANQYIMMNEGGAKIELRKVEQ